MVSKELCIVKSGDAATVATARWISKAALRDAGHGPVAEQAARAAVAPDDKERLHGEERLICKPLVQCHFHSRTTMGKMI
jgi:hypothetical protein